MVNKMFGQGVKKKFKGHLLFTVESEQNRLNISYLSLFILFYCIHPFTDTAYSSFLEGAGACPRYEGRVHPVASQINKHIHFLTYELVRVTN